MYPSYSGDRCITRVAAANVRAARCLKARRIVCFKKEIVVASRIGAQFGVVVKRAQRQWRAAAPTAHHFRGQQFFLFDFRRIRFQILTKSSNALVQLAKDDVCSVPAENFGFSSLHTAELISITQHKLPRSQRSFLRVRSRNSAAFDRRMADAVAKSEGFGFSW